MCYTFILRLAAQWAFSHQHHHKHRSNMIDITMAVTSLSDRKLSAPLQSYGTTVVCVVRHSPKCHNVAHNCILLSNRNCIYLWQTNTVSSLSGQYVSLIFTYYWLRSRESALPVTQLPSLWKPLIFISRSLSQSILPWNLLLLAVTILFSASTNL